MNILEAQRKKEEKWKILFAFQCTRSVTIAFFIFLRLMCRAVHPFFIHQVFSPSAFSYTRYSVFFFFFFFFFSYFFSNFSFLVKILLSILLGERRKKETERERTQQFLMANSRRIAQVAAVVAATFLKQDVDEQRNHIFSFFSFSLSLFWNPSRMIDTTTQILLERHRNELQKR